MEAFLLNVLHPLQRNGYLLSHSCYIRNDDAALLLVFYQAAGFLKFPPQAVVLLGQRMLLGLLSAAVY